MIVKVVKPTENTVVEVIEDTKFVIDLTKPQENVEYNIDFVFNVSGVSAEVLGLYVVKEDAKVSLTTSSTHLVPSTSCDVQVRTVLKDRAQSAYVGKIIIAKEAQQTSSFLHDAVLVVGEGTHNRSDPILQIDANDVKASHGATTGRISEEQIYYLKSRGLSEDQAKSIILEGFFEGILSKIQDVEVQEYFRKRLL